MPPPAPDLLGIGEFSRRSGLSIKALRHYHRLGILLPAYVHPGSGYRFYTRAQIAEVEDCRALAQLGVPLRRVRELRSSGMRSPDLRSTLLEIRDRVGERLRSEAVRLSWLEHSLARLECAPAPPAGREAGGAAAVDLVPVPGRLTLARRERLSDLSQGDALRDDLARRWGPGGELMDELEAATVWHDCGRATGTVDCEAVYPVPEHGWRGSRPATAGVGALQLAPCLAARVRPAPGRPLGEAYLAGWRRLISLGLPLAGPVREWVRYTGEASRVTEIHFPVAHL